MSWEKRYPKIGKFIKGSYWNSTKGIYVDTLCEIKETSYNSPYFECKVLTGELRDSMVAVSDNNIIKEYTNFDHCMRENAEYFI